MPYQTYTNDSDAQFAAELDKFKLGPGIRPGSTAKSASEAAMDSMGSDYKNVAAQVQLNTQNILNKYNEAQEKGANILRGVVG